MDLSQEHGRPFYLAMTLAPLTDVVGNNLGLIIVAEDIASQVLESVNEQLHAHRRDELKSLSKIAIIDL